MSGNKKFEYVIVTCKYTNAELASTTEMLNKLGKEGFDTHRSIVVMNDGKPELVFVMRREIPDWETKA